jgi:hypothetical protein
MNPGARAAKRTRRPAEGVCLVFLFSARSGFGVLVFAFLVVLRAGGFVFFAAFHFFAAAGGFFIGARAFFAFFAFTSKERGKAENGHGGESEEEFFHNDDFCFGSQTAGCGSTTSHHNPKISKILHIFWAATISAGDFRE